MKTKILKLKNIKRIESNSFNYDVQVKDNHNFFANDILVHNSLGIMFSYENKWRVATAGSFISEQAQWATKWMYNHMPLGKIDRNNTYLFEIVYPENKIVVQYDFAGLVLLAIVDSYGLEYDYEQLKIEASYLETKCVKQYDFDGMDSILAKAKVLDKNEEGYVIRFKNGVRLKIKGDEYVRIHRLISRVTPLFIWESILNGDNLEEVKKELPEEMEIDFESIALILQDKLKIFIKEVELLYKNTKSMTDKELGLYMRDHPEAFMGGQFNAAKKYIFLMRKGKFYESLEDLQSLSRRKIFNVFKPKSNVLEGYVPSSIINRFIDDM